MSAIKDVIRGDTHTISLEFIGVNGAINISDATVFFTVSAEKAPADDSAALIEKTITSHTDPTAGKTIITLNPEDTNSIAPGKYWYDVQVKMSNGDVFSLPKDRFVLVSDITRRSA